MRRLLVAAALLLSSCAAQFALHARCELACDEWSRRHTGTMAAAYRYDARADECVCYSPLAPDEKANYYRGDLQRETMVRFPAPQLGESL